MKMTESSYTSTYGESGINMHLLVSSSAFKELFNEDDKYIPKIQYSGNVNETHDFFLEVNAGKYYENGELRKAQFLLFSRTGGFLLDPSYADYPFKNLFDLNVYLMRVSVPFMNNTVDSMTMDYLIDMKHIDLDFNYKVKMKADAVDQDKITYSNETEPVARFRSLDINYVPEEGNPDPASTTVKKIFDYYVENQQLIYDTYLK